MKAHSTNRAKFSEHTIGRIFDGSLKKAENGGPVVLKRGNEVIRWTSWSPRVQTL